MTTTDCTITMVASRNYNIVRANGDTVLDSAGDPIRFLSKREALAEIDAICADAAAGVPEVRLWDGRDAEVLTAVRKEFAANPNIGISALYVALRAAGVKVSGRRMTPAVTAVREELQAAS